MRRLNLLYPGFNFLHPAALLFLLVVSSCGRAPASSNTATGEPRVRLEADAHRVTERSFTTRITATANLLAYEQVELKSPVAGEVTAIFFREGQHVRKGATLVRIDDRQWRAQKRGLEAQLISAQEDFRRGSELLSIQGVSQESVDQAEARVKNLEAQIEELDVMIDLATIRAPFNGRVGMRNFSVGTYLSPGETITSVVQADPLKVDFSVPSRYAAAMRKGTSVRVIASAGSDTARATVYAIDPQIDIETRSVQVRALLKNPDGKFFPGDFSDVLLPISDEEKAMFIPAESVIPELNAHIVFKVQEGKASRQEIALGRRTADKIQVLDGLSPGDTILLSGLLQVAEGDPVRVRDIKESAL